MKDERADRDRVASDIPEELRKKLEGAVALVTSEIRRRMIGKNRPFLVVIDGGSSAGKSTLAILVAAEIGAIIVQGDDFYQTDFDWKGMGAAEKAECCIDWQRARREALEPLLMGNNATWHPFNFQTGIGLADYTVTCGPASVIILDGAYASSPQIADLIDFSILVDTPNVLRHFRHNEREGHDDADWHAIWDEAEAYYFTHVRPPSSFDLVISLS